MSEVTGAVPEQTTELPRADRQRPSYVTLAFVAVAGLSLVSGLWLGARTLGGPQTTVVAEGRIDERGGTLRFEETGELRVVAGALSSPATIVVRRTVVDRPLRLHLPDGLEREVGAGELAAYTFEPADLRFEQPATIVLPLTGTGGTLAVVREGVVLFLDGVVDTGAGTVTFEVLDLAFRAGRAPER